MKKKPDVPSVPVYFSQRPKPGCFHAVEFGTRHTPRGPIYGAYLGCMLDNEEKWLEPNISNALKNLDRRMFIKHDGTIIDTFNHDFKAQRITRSAQMTWKEQ